MSSHMAQKYTDPNIGLEEVFDDEDLLKYYSLESPVKVQKHQGLDEDVYISRIQRRTDLVKQLRNGYLRDVIAVKQFIGQHLAETEREAVYAKWQESIPSIDLNEHFMLYSPPATSIDVIPCDACGGSLEVVHHDNEKLTQLANSLETVRRKAHAKTNEFGILVAQKNMEIEKLESEREGMQRKHASEVRSVNM
jgi:hypothetical protein